MRKFWLENEHGKLWNLTSNNRWDKSSSFFSDPDGLGVKTKIDSYEIENTMFVEEITTQPQIISGIIYFTDYDHFQRFAEFIGNVNNNKPMKLYYSVNGISHDNRIDKQWYKLVLISELKKSEIDIKTASLKVAITFDCLSRWRQDKEIILKMAITGSPLLYPYKYPFLYNGVNYLAVEINNSGNLPSSCIVRIDGVTQTPTFRVLQNGSVIDQARYALTINTNEYLLVNSSAEKQEASLYKIIDGQNIIESVYALGEKNYLFSNFVTIPTGVSTFIIAGLNETLGQVTISYSIQRELI